MPKRRNVNAASPATSIDLHATEVDHVLRVLDFEIERVSSEQARPGWSLWALYGAMATVIWLLIEQTLSGLVDVSNTLHLFVAFSALMSARHLFLSLQSFGKSRSTSSPRFNWVGDATNRLEILLSFVKNSAVTLVALLVPAGVVWYYRATAVSTYGIMAVLALFTLVISLFRFPISRQSPAVDSRIGKLLAAGLWILSAGILTAIAYGYIFSLTTSPRPVTASDIKTAGLIVVLPFLVRALTLEHAPRPLLVSLIETRRDLVFGQADLNAAIKRAEIAILGMNESDVLQLDISEILDSFEKVDIQVALVDQLIDS